MGWEDVDLTHLACCRTKLWALVNMVEKFQDTEFFGWHSGKFSGRTWLREVSY